MTYTERDHDSAPSSTGSQQLIADIEREVRYTQGLTGRKRLDARVMAAIKAVPRDWFVPSESRFLAYSNQPLAIGYGQTISQPYIVALMTDLLAAQDSDRVLEIGTGSGYQAAILSRLCAEVYTIERIEKLQGLAQQCFNRLGCNNIHSRVGDGCYGWPEQAPFDSILVTAAAASIPQALLDQLKPGGRLVIPVGSPGMYQELRLIEKDPRGRFTSSTILGVAFVPLVQDGGQGDHPEW